MPLYDVLIGFDVRCYIEAEVEANDPADLENKLTEAVNNSPAEVAWDTGDNYLLIEARNEEGELVFDDEDLVFDADGKVFLVKKGHEEKKEGAVGE